MSQDKNEIRKTYNWNGNVLNYICLIHILSIFKEKIYYLTDAQRCTADNISVGPSTPNRNHNLNKQVSFKWIKVFGND